MRSCYNCARGCKVCYDIEDYCQFWKPAEWLFIPTMFELEGQRLKEEVNKNAELEVT